MTRPSRILILPAAAILILGLCVWRIATPRQRVDIDPSTLSERRPAPPFELYNQKSKLVQLQSYLNRHRIVLVFFDGAAGPEASDVLRQLRDFHPALEREGIVVFGVSTQLPQQIRGAAGTPFPFDLLSDVNAAAADSVHRRWGRLAKPEAGTEGPKTNPGVFLIDRGGLVGWQNNAPRPERDTTNLIRDLLAGG